MPGSRRKDDRQAGYTLVELLVAFAVTAMMAALVFGGMRFGARAWDRSSSVVQVSETMFATQARLRQLIGSAYPFQTTRGVREITYPMVGYDDAVLFSAPLSPDSAEDQLSRIAIWHDTANAALTLAWAEDRNDVHDPRDGDGYQTLRLLNDVSRVAIDYLTSDDNGVSTRWVSRWNRQSGLPHAVRISVEFRSGAGRSWPVLIAVPRLNGIADCEFDPVSRRCRS